MPICDRIPESFLCVLCLRDVVLYREGFFQDNFPVSSSYGGWRQPFTRLDLRTCVPRIPFPLVTWRHLLIMCWLLVWWWVFALGKGVFVVFLVRFLCVSRFWRILHFYVFFFVFACVWFLSFFIFNDLSISPVFFEAEMSVFFHCSFLGQQNCLSLNSHLPLNLKFTSRYSQILEYYFLIFKVWLFSDLHLFFGEWTKVDVYRT